jgi:hypothetical protein
LQVLQCRAKLRVRGFTDGKYAGGLFAALVKRGIDIGHTLADDLAQPLAHGADMHPDNGVYRARLDQLVHHRLHRRAGLDGRVDHDQFHRPPGDPVAAVEFANRDLCT